MKSPRLRFKPGQFIRSKKDNQLYEIMFAYRYSSAENIWLFTIEERESLQTPTSPIATLLESKSRLPDRVYKGLFRDYYDAHGYFGGYYAHGSRIASLSTQKLLNGYALVSSGAVEINMASDQGTYQQQSDRIKR